MGTRGERRRFIQEAARKIDDFPAAHRVEFRAACRPLGFRQSVGAVERVIEAAPSGVCGVERVAGVGKRDHELRPSGGRNLRVDIGRGDRTSAAFRNQIADFRQKGAVHRHVDRAAAMALVPGVDLLLLRIPFNKQRPVTWCQVTDDRIQRRPELLGIGAGAGNRLLVDEIMEFPRNQQAAYLDTIRHAVGLPFLDITPCESPETAFRRGAYNTAGAKA